MPLELIIQDGMSKTMLRKDHQAAGVFIQTRGDMSYLIFIALFLLIVFNAIDQAVLFGNVMSRYCCHAGSFVDHQKIPIFINDIKWFGTDRNMIIRYFWR